MSAYLIDYPFARRLFPSALKVLARLTDFGSTVILSDGDVVFQPRKVERAGLSDAVDGRVLIYIHKEEALDDVERCFPAEHYVLVDEKPRILTAVKRFWGNHVTTIFSRQGSYAHDARTVGLPADITIERIGDLLHNLGQSLWLDNITRDLLNSGTLRYINQLSVTGLTSKDLFFELALADLTRAADLLDGWVSLEVSPLLAHDTQHTIAAARDLSQRGRKSNLFIKIPGTKEGLPAIEAAIFAGVPVNVTLLFSLGRQANDWGRRPLLLIGLGALPVRALLFALTSEPQALLVFQLLDGASGAVVGVLTALVVADLTNRTGRFNLAQGMVGTASGVGAAMPLFGVMAVSFGRMVVFLSIAAASVLVLWFLMPETRPATKQLAHE
jgi:hypothetical protein